MDIQVIQRLLTDDSIGLTIATKHDPYNSVSISCQIDDKNYGIALEIGKSATLVDKVNAAYSNLAHLLLTKILQDDSHKSEHTDMYFEVRGILQKKRLEII